MNVKKQSATIQQTVCHAFRTAYLLTGSIEQAESAVLEAIDSFDADDHERILFRSALNAAVRGQPGTPLSRNMKVVDASLIPLELRRVLNLAHNQRRCFVLRILVGVSRQACARLLNLTVRHVDHYTCAAMLALAGVEP